ncbi:MAG: alpha/beta fold hydrolase [Gammaproteobacteria bacterium]
MSPTDLDRVRYVEVNKLRLAYESFGAEDAPMILLIHGLATQMLAWPTSLCETIAAEGYRVVRFDNRDIGLSSTLDELGKPNIPWLALQSWLGVEPNPPYMVRDMADDAFTLMRALGAETAHVVGASMGGMIAQHMGALHPDRIQTLTMIMSSSGAKGLPDTRKDLQKLMASPPLDDDPEAAIQHALRFWQAIASPAYPPDPSTLEAFVRACAARCAPGGANETRHLAAVIADGSRVDILRRIRIPALVIHGDADPLVPLECGADIARHIPNSRLEIVVGMGHDLPVQLVDRLATLLVTHFSRPNEDSKQ